MGLNRSRRRIVPGGPGNRHSSRVPDGTGTRPDDQQPRQGRTYRIDGTLMKIGGIDGQTIVLTVGVDREVRDTWIEIRQVAIFSDTKDKIISRNFTIEELDELIQLLSEAKREVEWIDVG